MIQNYEKDKKIDKWDAGTFIKYLQETNAVLGQDANWANISENVIHGQIRACPLVSGNGNTGITNCIFIKGIFNGWVSHAFGDLSKTVYESQGKKPCEIYIALKGD